MIEINPYISLLIFLMILIVVAFFFWPKIGVLERYRRLAKNTKKELIEDALKHLYDYESHELSSTLNSIAGNLGVSADKASKIVENLKKMNLVLLDDQLLSLTDAGRSYALRVIRVHRLWENYLAEETGVKEIDWHDEAEKVEHLLSQEDADMLSAKMGNPKFDPHGDPIPTNDGSVYFKKGKLLNTIEINDVAKVIHVEDEPKAIYTQLLNEGIYPGQEIKIVEKTRERLTIAADGDERVLTPLIASKVSVEVLENKVFENIKNKTLFDLVHGETAEVVGLSPNCRGQQRRRLLDFGIVPGAKISVHMDSPLKDPIAYLVKETMVALRENQAKKILIN